MPPDASLINLPHAHTIVGRLARYLESRTSPIAVDETEIPERLTSLDSLLVKFPNDPPESVALRASEAAAEHARALAAEIVRAGYAGDRLGQCVRNLFECLGLPAEGAQLSLQCGERPDSPLRP